jgi:hypothetical protein
MNDECKSKGKGKDMSPVTFTSAIHETPHLKEVALKHMAAIIEYIEEFRTSKQNGYDS